MRLPEDAARAAEEALERETELFDSLGDRVEDFDYVAQVALQAAAPSIRSQQRQRVREAAKAFFAGELEISESVGSRAEVECTRSLAKGLLAALGSDGLEYCDDPCTCGHERFHHEDGFGLGIDMNCKACGCTCKQFTPDSNTREEEGK